MTREHSTLYLKSMLRCRGLERRELLDQKHALLKECGLVVLVRIEHVGCACFPCGKCGVVLSDGCLAIKL